MDVKNCRKCGRIFNYISGMPICQSCREEMEKKFQEVKEYIRENKGSGIHEVAEACGVEVNQIHQWIREERLLLSDDSPIGISCESCGATIKTGRFCTQCKNNMANNLTNAFQKKEAPSRLSRASLDDRSHGMRYIGK